MVINNGDSIKMFKRRVIQKLFRETVGFLFHASTFRAD
jgi:hypothetical protein